VNVALAPEIPLDVVAVAGTVATDGVPLVRLTMATQLLHNPLTVTVPVALPPEATDVGESVNEATSALSPRTAANGPATTSPRNAERIRILDWSRAPRPLNMIRPPRNRRSLRWLSSRSIETKRTARCSHA
jgi:hypothetical protein